MAAFDDEVQPFTLTVITDNIPTQLRDRNQWVLWAMEKRSGKWTKPPVSIHTHRAARTNAPVTWAAFSKVEPAVTTGAYPGAGFVFSADDPLFFLDLDHCVDPDTGEIDPRAQWIVDAFINITYIEYSPSRTGLHIIGEGVLPGTQHTKAIGENDMKVEMFDRVKYCTITGHRLDGAAHDVLPCQDALDALYARVFGQEDVNPFPEFRATASASDPLSDDDEARLSKARESKNGARFVRLYDVGDISAYGNDRSRADQALCNDLAFWLDANPGRVAQAMERSALARPKFHEIHAGDGSTYLEMTVAKAVASCPEPYRQPGPRPRLHVVPDPVRPDDDDTGSGPSAPPDSGQDRATGAGEEPPAKPQLLAQDQNIPELSRASWEALQTANKPERMFRFGDIPTRLDPDDNGVPVPQPLTSDRLLHEMARSAEWVRYSKDPASGDMKLRHAKPPRDVALDMLAAPSFPLPGLRSIVHAPVYAPDKTLHSKAGYHPAGQTYLHLARGFSVPAVPDRPTSAHIDNARRLIEEELLGDFSFVSQADRANAIALFLVPYVRNLINGPTPLNLIEAPTMGSGKGLLVDALLRPAVGSDIKPMPAANDDDEWRKRIHAQLAQAPAAVLIDNVTNGLDSGSLASVLTTTVWSDRRLGSNQMVHMPVRCIWVATANNPTMTTEIARRSVRIRIDPKVDRPWQRGESEFRHPSLRTWIDKNRGELVAAGLTLVQHWISEGAQLGTAHLGSFEQWSQLMGGILTSAGIPKFLGNLDAFYEAADLEGAVWRQFIDQWFDKHGTGEVGVADLFSLALAVDGFDFGKGSERSQKVVFGTSLNRQRDRVIGSYRIVNTRTVQRVKRWRLIQIDAAANPFAGLYGDQDDSDVDNAGQSDEAFK